MTKWILKFFEENPSAYYYLGWLIILFSGLFFSALLGYILSLFRGS